jgi:hypothetical protein
LVGVQKQKWEYGKAPKKITGRLKKKKKKNLRLVLADFGPFVRFNWSSVLFEIDSSQTSAITRILRLIELRMNVVGRL